MKEYFSLLSDFLVSLLIMWDESKIKILMFILHGILAASKIYG